MKEGWGLSWGCEPEEPLTSHGPGEVGEGVPHRGQSAGLGVTGEQGPQCSAL